MYLLLHQLIPSKSELWTFAAPYIFVWIIYSTQDILLKVHFKSTFQKVHNTKCLKKKCIKESYIRGKCIGGERYENILSWYLDT